MGTLFSGFMTTCMVTLVISTPSSVSSIGVGAVVVGGELRDMMSALVELAKS